MKKYMLLVLSLCLLFPAWATADNGIYYSGYKAPEKEVIPPEAFRCPVSQMSDQDKCLLCHIQPTFAVKEPNPDDLYDYPNRNTKIKGDSGYIRVNAIDADVFLDSVEYLADRHGIKNITVEVSSFGGSLFDAWGIQGTMAQYERKGVVFTTTCSTYAMSAGFLVLVAGTNRLVSSKAELMFHELWTFEMFKISTPSGTEEQAKILRHIQDSASTWLASKSKLTKEEIDAKIHKSEWWMNGNEAHEAGFVDGFLD